jgi:hypothetical protein
MLPDMAGQVLHGLEPVQYRLLRELTRGHRGKLAWTEQQLRPTTVATEDPVYVRYRKDAEGIMGYIKKAVHNVRAVDG